MSVARSFQETGYHVTQSEYYLDSDTGKAREIDLVARLEFPVEGEGKGICVTLVVECKVAPKPWVVFSSGQQVYPLSLFDALVSPAGEILLSNQEEFGDLSTRGIICGPNCVAYGATVALRAKNDEQDQAYRACTTVAKAAMSYHGKEPLWGHSNVTEWATLTLPVIIIDGSMFTARLDESGDLEVEAVDRSRLVLKNPELGNSAPAIIDVVTRRYLPQFAQSLKEEIQGIVKLCEENPDLLSERAIPAARWFSQMLSRCEEEDMPGGEGGKE